MDRWTYAPHVAWAVEKDGLTLIDKSAGRVERLGYPEAAIWDLIGRETAIDSLASKISVITSVSYELARGMVLDRIREWSEAGWLTERERHG